MLGETVDHDIQVRNDVDAYFISYILNNKGLPYEEAQKKAPLRVDQQSGKIVSFNLEKLPKNIRKFIRKSKLDVSASKNQKYTEQDAIDALRKAATYYFPLSTSQYNHLRFIGEIAGPRSRWIEVKMNGWKNACLKAGIESPSARNKNSNTRWSEEELWNFFERYYIDSDTTGSKKNYDDWRNKQPDEIPSSTVLIQRLGDWDSVREEFLESLYDKRN